MNKRFHFGKASTSAILYFLLIVALPLATLIVFGLAFLWQNNLLLQTTAIWLLIAAIAYVALMYWPKHKAAQLAIDTDSDHQDHTDATTTKENKALPLQLPARADWTTTDLEQWQRCCVSIETQLESQPDWQSLPELALEQLASIAAQYHGTGKNAQFQFTVPELLLVVSVTSSRYRQLVIEYVPFIDKFSIATGTALFDHKENIGTGYKWFNRLRRTARLLNPASAVVGELRDLISNKIFSQASEAVQNDLKRLLLQEAAQVGIDLYSGKLIVSDEQLSGYRSNAAIADEQRQVSPAEPIRIVLIGQTSSGKSSMVNALSDALQAETDVLPTTEKLTVHALRIDGEPVANLIDTPGIDDTQSTYELLLDSAIEADLIIWLVKATQPARAPDQQLLDNINHHYSQQIQKLPAPVIMALTHIDQLSPKNQWQPPYDLQGDKPKAKSITAAINASRSAIGFSDETLVIPLFLGDAHAHYNVDALASQIMLLNDESINVQLNRRRLELGSKSNNWQARWSQTKKLGRVIGKSIVRKVKN